jgi:hypothetical protein
MIRTTSKWEEIQLIAVLNVAVLAEFEVHAKGRNHVNADACLNG